MTDENIRQTKSYDGQKHMTDENIRHTKTYDGRKHMTNEKHMRQQSFQSTIYELAIYNRIMSKTFYLSKYKNRPNRLENHDLDDIAKFIYIYTKS